MQCLELDAARLSGASSQSVGSRLRDSTAGGDTRSGRVCQCLCAACLVCPLCLCAVCPAGCGPDHRNRPPSVLVTELPTYVTLGVLGCPVARQISTDDAATVARPRGEDLFRFPFRSGFACFRSRARSRAHVCLLLFIERINQSNQVLMTMSNQENIIRLFTYTDAVFLGGDENAIIFNQALRE